MFKYASDMLPNMNDLFIVNSTIHEHNTTYSDIWYTPLGNILIIPIDLFIMLVTYIERST